MKSKVMGRNYIVQFDGDEFVSKLNKRKTDRVLRTLEDSLRKMLDCLESDVNHDADLYDFVRVILYDNNFEESNLKAMLHDIQCTRNVLATHNDEIVDSKDIVTLESLGYKVLFWMHRPFYEKVLEDTHEKEVVEEIQCYNDTISRRLRITIWETKPGVRSSKSIRYRRLKIGKKLLKCIQNSVEEWKEVHKEKS